MRFNWRETLRRTTGSETRCPGCGADGLVVTERDERDVLPDLRGLPYCRCPHCGFAGDFSDAAALAGKKGVEETVRDLRARGELEISARDLEAFVARKLLQDEVDAYFSRCVEAIREAPHKSGIRAGMSASNLRQLPPQTGLYLPKGAPRPFALLQANRYQQATMTLYRYVFDGETTCIDAQNAKTTQREHRLRVTGNVGVYLGNYRYGEVPEVVVATHNPRVAGLLYGALRAESSLPPPVIGLAGFPLPQAYEFVRILYLLDTPDAPLPLSFAIRAASTKTVYGCDRAPQIRVLSPAVPASDITAADVRILGSNAPHGKPLRAWLAARLLAMADRREEVANALLQSGATDDVRADLVSLLGDGAPEGLVSTILLPTTEPDDVFALGNGRLVKSTPVGIYTAARTGKHGTIVTKTLLCNVGLTVESRFADKGHETAVCTVTHPDADVPSVPVRLPHAHWNNPDALAEDIRAAYAAFGRTPYIAFYRSAGYAWSDILQYLGAHCPVQTGVKALGATPDGDVNLPNAVLSKGVAGRQTKCGLIRPGALEAYSALPCEVAADGLDRLLHFLSSEVSLERTGVAAGLLHALFCTAGRMFDRSGVRRPPSHLVFVETEPGIWDATLRTLAYVFSGSEYVPLMDYSDRAGFLKDWADLGTLPLVTRLPAADDLATILAASPVSVLAVTDPLTALSLSGRGTVSFVLPNVEAESADAGLSLNDVESLRTAFVAVAAQKAGTPWLDIGFGGAVSLSTPCLSALGTLTDERDPKSVAGGLYRSVKGRYPGAGITGAKAFFGVLHRAWLAHVHGDATGIPLTMVAGNPTDALAASFNDRGEHVFITAEQVLVSRSVVQLVNREKTFLFDTEQLSREFTENGILLEDAPGALGIDGRRVWVFPRRVWDAEVVRAAGFTNRKDKK